MIMKKIYQKPVTDLILIETQKMIALSQNVYDGDVDDINELDSREYDWDD